MNKSSFSTSSTLSSTLLTLLPTAVHHRFPPATTRRFPPFSLFHLPTAMCSSFLPVRFLYPLQFAFNTIQDALHQAPLLFHHFSPSTYSSLRLLHYKDGGACWTAYPYAAPTTCIPLCIHATAFILYKLTSLSHWPSWPLGSNRQ